MGGPPARATPAVARPIRESLTLGKNITTQVRFQRFESASGVAIRASRWHISSEQCPTARKDTRL